MISRSGYTYNHTSKTAEIAFGRRPETNHVHEQQQQRRFRLPRRDLDPLDWNDRQSKITRQSELRELLQIQIQNKQHRAALAKERRLQEEVRFVELEMKQKEQEQARARQRVRQTASAPLTTLSSNNNSVVSNQRHHHHQRPSKHDDSRGGLKKPLTEKHLVLPPPPPPPKFSNSDHHVESPAVSFLHECLSSFRQAKEKTSGEEKISSPEKHDQAQDLVDMFTLLLSNKAKAPTTTMSKENEVPELLSKSQFIQLDSALDMSSMTTIPTTSRSRSRSRSRSSSKTVSPPPMLTRGTFSMTKVSDDSQHHENVVETYQDTRPLTSQGYYAIPSPGQEAQMEQELFSKQRRTRSRRTLKQELQEHPNQNLEHLDLDDAHPRVVDLQEEEDLGLLSLEEDLDLSGANEKDPQVTLKNRFQVHSVSQNVRQVMSQVLARHQGQG